MRDAVHHVSAGTKSLRTEIDASISIGAGNEASFPDRARNKNGPDEQ
jgi:hypothetical protein